MSAPNPQGQSAGLRGNGSFVSRGGVGLLEVEPDLVRFLSEEQRAAAERFALPLAVAERHDDVETLLEAEGAFGALVLDGLLVQAVSVDRQSTLRLIGPGDIAPIARDPRPIPSHAARVVAAARTELAMLGDEFLLAGHRWPWLLASHHDRMMEQSERLMTQLAISQLPKVEDRLMAMMWLLADGWGHVTPAGVRLAVSLSHETLGGLIGARRPTVTLAVKKLAQCNALIKQGHAWLILEAPADPVAGTTQIPDLLSEPRHTSPWTPAATSSQGSAQSHICAQEATRVREDCASQTRRAEGLRARSTELCGQSRELGQASRAARRHRSGGETRDAEGRPDTDAPPKALHRADRQLPQPRPEASSRIAA